MGRPATFMLTAMLLGGCWNGARVEHGAPASEFTAAQIAGQSIYIGDVVEVTGAVTTPATAPDSRVTLDRIIVCEFSPQLSAMAQSMRASQEVRIRGILRECDANGARLTNCLQMAE